VHDDDLTGGPFSRGDPHDWELLASYVAGQVAPNERSAVEARLKVDPGFRASLKEARLVWERAGSALDTPVVPSELERAWSRLAADMDAAERAIPLRARGRNVPRWRSAALAASVLLVLGLGFAWFAPRVFSPAGVAGGPVREFVAPYGQRLSVRLADGSRVLLAPGSELHVPKRFGSTSREVLLEGRAYFEVVSDSTRPFLVRAGNAVTRVLGTEFGVRAYPGAVTAEVVVRSGRVAVRPSFASTSSARVLIRGDRGVVGTAGEVQVESGVDVDALLAWTAGDLSFRSTPLRDVAPELERWFDVEIEVTDPALGDRRITATFEQEPLDTVLRIVAELVDARVEREGRHVVFSPRRSR
jgi:transmembrane sensor